MVFCLIFALLFSLCYINILLVEIVNVKFNTLDMGNGKAYALLRLILIVLMSITWGIYIHFG
jgi:hypothetical protein